MKNYDVAIIGGGLTGLTAANFLAKAGKKVILFEKAKRLGGRSITNIKNGVYMNLGARGLFLQGEAMKMDFILQEIGLEITNYYLMLL